MKEAARQLSWKYGHARAGLTGVLDYAVEQLHRGSRRAGHTYDQWVAAPEYDHKAIKQEFRASLVGHPAHREACCGGNSQSILISSASPGFAAASTSIRSAVASATPPERRPVARAGAVEEDGGGRLHF